MKKYGHYGLTILLSIPLIFGLSLWHSVPVIAMMLIMSLFPNKELALTVLSRRGIVHTVWFAVFIAGVFMGAIALLLMLVEIGIQELAGETPAFFNPLQMAFILAVGVFLGNLSHILGDVLIGSGSKPAAKPFWPVLRIPVCFGLAKERHPLVNDGLLKFAVPLFILLYAIRIGFRPIYLY